jgi:KUP system potassium uptake protein
VSYSLPRGAFNSQPGGDLGAFSVTHQAIQLGFLPRLSIRHTHQEHHGQIYIPFVNWRCCTAVVLLVLFFGDSSSLASGILVSRSTGAMLIDTCLLAGRGGPTCS